MDVLGSTNIGDVLDIHISDSPHPHILPEHNPQGYFREPHESRSPTIRNDESRRLLWERQRIKNLPVLDLLLPSLWRTKTEYE